MGGLLVERFLSTIFLITLTPRKITQAPNQTAARKQPTGNEHQRKEAKPQKGKRCKHRRIRTASNKQPPDGTKGLHTPGPTFTQAQLPDTHPITGHNLNLHVRHTKGMWKNYATRHLQKGKRDTLW